MKVVLMFLTDLFESGLGYSAINTAKSAISAVLCIDDVKTVGSHPEIIRFMKGVYELRTPLPKYCETWDVSVVLSYLEGLDENQNLPLKDLTLKLCALLLLTSAQRVQTIHLIRLSLVNFHKDGCSIYFVDKLKHSKPGKAQTVLRFPKLLEKEKLCVVACLQAYIEKTKDIRQGTDKLLLCYCKPHGPASKDTVARWVKSVLTNAGIQGFGPHSFRGASSSAMVESGVSLQDVLKSAGWSNASTFRKYYYKPVAEKTKPLKESVPAKNSLLRYFSTVKK